METTGKRKPQNVFGGNASLIAYVKPGREHVFKLNKAQALKHTLCQLTFSKLPHLHFPSLHDLHRFGTSFAYKVKFTFAAHCGLPDISTYIGKSTRLLQPKLTTSNTNFNNVSTLHNSSHESNLDMMHRLYEPTIQLEHMDMFPL